MDHLTLNSTPNNLLTITCWYDRSIKKYAILLIWEFKKH